MKLIQEDEELFFKLYNSLLNYVNKKNNVTKNDLNSDDQAKMKVRTILFNDVSIIDAYIKDNPNKFSQENLNIILGWKTHIVDDFIILRQLSKYAIFMLNGKAYGVVALSMELGDMVQIPAYVGAILLPFKGRIIYDGLMTARYITFGGGIKRGFNEDYNKAKAKYGIITTLETESLDEEADENEEDLKMMKFYFKSKTNYENYSSEIFDLKDKNKVLETEYYQSLGKLFAKPKKKTLRNIIKDKTFFAIYENVTVASGKTRAEVEKNVKKVISKDKLNHIYYFDVKN